MNLINLQLKKLIKTLEVRNLEYALCGGLVASIYRNEIRTTQDIDIAVIINSSRAKEIIEELKLKFNFIRKADIEGGPLFAIKKQNTPVCIVIGRGAGIGIDILLPEIPWVQQAITRAQNNLTKFGTSKIPTLTIEDLILSKVYSFQNNQNRFKDLDDLQSIFLNPKNAEIDYGYLIGCLKSLNLNFSKLLLPNLPKVLFEFAK